MKDFTILYANSESSRYLGVGLEFFREHSEELYEKLRTGLLTHVALATIRVDSIDDLYMIMQGENWSSGGRELTVQPLIKELGLWHTSLSVGDLAIDHDTGHLHFCDVYGWTDMGHFWDFFPCGSLLSYDSVGEHLEEINRGLLSVNDLYPLGWG